MTMFLLYILPMTCSISYSPIVPTQSINQSIRYPLMKVKVRQTQLVY